MDPADHDGQLPLAKPLRPAPLEAVFVAPPAPAPRRDAILDGLPDDDCTAKLAFSLGVAKIGAGILIACLGMGALLLQATLAGIGAGMWAGVAVLVSGVVGILSSRLPRNYGVLVAFVCCSITSLSTSALLLIFSATGLARDLHERGDDDTGADLLFHAVFPDGLGRPNTALNAALVALALVDCVLSAACVALVCSEACAAGAPKDASWGGRAERKTRQERLRSWVDQQQIGCFWPQGGKPVFPNSTIWRSGGDFAGTPCHSCISRDTGDSTLSRKSVTGIDGGNGNDPSLNGGQTRY